MLQTSINERFSEIAKRLYNGNISAMAVETGIARTTLQDIVSGRKASPGYDIIRKIAEISAAKISLDWLILGVGEMLDSQESNIIGGNNINNGNNNSIVNGDNIALNDTWYNEVIAAKDAVIAEKDKRISDMEKRISEKDEYIALLKSQK